MARLVRKGLLPSKDLPLLKTAMVAQQRTGDIAKLSKSHRDVLQRYNSALSSAAYGSKQSVQNMMRNIQSGYEAEGEEMISERVAVATDPPMVLILKRKGVRIFPDGKRVALYSNEKLGLSFTVPYNAENANAPAAIGSNVVGVGEEVVFESIEQLAEIKQGETKKMNVGGEKIDVAHETAMNIMRLHSQLNDDNRKALQKHITDPMKFRRIAKLAAKTK